MDYEQLCYDLQYASSIKLLKADNAALIISFLYYQFKQEQQISLALTEVVERLESYLESLNEREPGRFARKAQAYISEWADEQHQFIRIIAPIPGKSEKPLVELTSATERVLGWLEEMHVQTFVGTESRFLLVVQMLQDIVHGSTEDPSLKLAQLERQRDDLQRQIDSIRQTGKVESYSPTQIKERFFEVSNLARQLLRDFHLVEDHFREIARSVQEAQLQPGVRKGSLVEYVLDAGAELKSSDQGRSFYAFWDFLMAPSSQEELYTLLDKLQHIPDLSSISSREEALRYLPKNLIMAGEQVVQSNYRLTEQLRRILDEKAVAESRRVRELVLEIKHEAHRLLERPPADEAFLELEGPPAISLVMERGLWEPVETIPVERQPTNADPRDLHGLDLSHLYNQFYIDEAQLQQNIERLLEFRPQVTLPDLLEQYPLQKGLSELLTYCAIAAQNPVHCIDTTQLERIPVAALSDRIDSARIVTLPRILYRREEYE